MNFSGKRDILHEGRPAPHSLPWVIRVGEGVRFGSGCLTSSTFFVTGVWWCVNLTHLSMPIFYYRSRSRFLNRLLPEKTEPTWLSLVFPSTTAAV